ncbi:MAG TPA: 2OG-Fe(II) oxygenase [Steroidobacter sp.]
MDTARIADQISTDGFATIGDAFSPPLIGALRRSCTEGEGFVSAAVGRGAGRASRSGVRGDVIKWLDDANEIDDEYLAVMESLRTALNERLYLGLFDYECHYAIYDTGMKYAKHSDVLQGTHARLLSTVTYLNDSWTAANGGELVLYRGSDPTRLASILPQPGLLVVFLSEEFPHEVLTANKPRHSIAGWFRGRAGD